jgi:ion channel-forming bestrophin family protein
MLLLGFVTGTVAYFESAFLSVNLSSLTLFHQISGFVISLVLVFRINTGYDRWWEGRKLWGSLVNNTRNLAIKLHAVVPASDLAARQELAGLITSFPYSLKEFLRDNKTDKGIEFGTALKREEYMTVKHGPNLIARELNASVLAHCARTGSTSDHFLVMSEQLTSFTDIAGACERIKNTPIPYSYSIFIKKIIFLYIITMPVDFGMSMGYWSIPVVMIMFYAFASLELISEEIEEPFGSDSNDLPLDELSAKIRGNVKEILLPHGT